ncbi:hypothetical protein Pst134EB_008517 [Puccinia striiformis f. sp. tritici]|nr:hypothetical protein Pst134EB_008517 [Puccinia striiformis f. sp. tritici]
MLESKFSRRNPDPSKPLPAEEENLLATLYKWCKGKRDGWSMYHTENEADWVTSKIKELGEIKVTRGTVSIAVDFHIFAMIWYSSGLYDSFAIALALSRTSNWPYDDEQVVGSKVSFWKRTDHLMEFKEYQQAAKMTIIDDPYNGNYFQFSSNLGRYDQDSCHLNILKNLISFAQALDLSFIHEESYLFFWKSLHAAADREELHPLIEYLHDFCTTFKNGIPFDNSFKYHQLVSQTSLKIMNHLDSITGTVSVTNDKNNISTLSKMSVGDFNEEIIEFFVKAKLVMNFVEEFSQHVKQKGIISRFYPKPRATPAQIRHLAFLICDQMSMIYNLELDLMAHNINKELELHEFPHVIQHDMLGIMGNQHASFGNLREYLIQKIIASRIERSAAINNMYGQLIESLTKMKSESNHPSFNQLKQRYQEDIFLKLDELERLHIHPHTPDEFQNNSSVWGEAHRIILLELSPISHENAQKLIVELKRGHRIRRNAPVFYDTYYVMTQTNEKEKEIIFMVMSHELNKLEDILTPVKLNKLKKIYDVIRGLSSETTYDVWKKIFFEKILQLEHDLALIFDDILKDASRTILANKSNAVCKKAKLQTMFEAIDDNLLTPQINRKLKHLIQLLTAHRMEYEIPMMACLLIKGEISDFSTYQVGDLLTKSIENMHKIL